MLVKFGEDKHRNKTPVWKSCSTLVGVNFYNTTSDASRYHGKAKSDQICIDVGIHFGPCSARGRYAKSDGSTAVLPLFSDMRDPKNEC